MHQTKAHVALLSFLSAAFVATGLQMSAGAQQTPSTSTSAASAGQTVTMTQADTADQAARDAQFVNCFLISCAGIGAIIAFVVWRSLPPKSKADTKNN